MAAPIRLRAKVRKGRGWATAILGIFVLMALCLGALLWRLASIRDANWAYGPANECGEARVHVYVAPDQLSKAVLTSQGCEGGPSSFVNIISDHGSASSIQVVRAYDDFFEQPAEFWTDNSHLVIVFSTPLDVRRCLHKAGDIKISYRLTGSAVHPEELTYWKGWYPASKSHAWRNISQLRRCASSQL